MLAARVLYRQNVRRLVVLRQLRGAVVRDNRRKRGALREGGRIDLDILEEEEWVNLFR